MNKTIYLRKENPAPTFGPPPQPLPTFLSPSSAAQSPSQAQPLSLFLPRKLAQLLFSHALTCIAQQHTMAQPPFVFLPVHERHSQAIIPAVPRFASWLHKPARRAGKRNAPPPLSTSRLSMGLIVHSHALSGTNGHHRPLIPASSRLLVSSPPFSYKTRLGRHHPIPLPLHDPVLSSCRRITRSRAARRRR